MDSRDFAGDGARKRFARCFSFSRSENVAMWMLYGGTEGKGLMIDISQALINGIVEKCVKVELGNWSNNKFCVKQELHKGEFELFLIDILYYGAHDETDKNSDYDLKRSDSKYELGKKATIEKLKFCKKSYPWNYENECRLILELKEDATNSAITDARIEFREIYEECLKKSNVRVPIKIFASPNYKGKHNYNESTLYGKMDWNMCSDCNLKK